MSLKDEFNPLDYENLTKSCVEELMGRGPFKLPLEERFGGAGVYALFYDGDHPIYQTVRSPAAETPIYVGKAVPPGARKGKKQKKPNPAPLCSRIGEHVRSIQAAENLRIEDFVCRYLVVTPLWITMAERFLLEHYQPMWNVMVEGFGIHAPGKGRHAGKISWWDALHPGRYFAANLQQTRTVEMAEERLREFLAGQRPPEIPPDDEEESEED